MQFFPGSLVHVHHCSLIGSGRNELRPYIIVSCTNIRYNEVYQSIASAYSASSLQPQLF